jgi:hypothetical protein
MRGRKPEPIELIERLLRLAVAAASAAVLEHDLRVAAEIYAEMGSRMRDALYGLRAA